jgi:DNA-binding SARP family transcriptional activator
VQASLAEEHHVTVARPPVVQAYLLGGFRVVVHGHVVDDHAWRRRSARQLFKCLLSRPKRRMTRDEIVELFWPDSDAEAASTNLRSTIHAMRRALAPAEDVDALGMVFGDRDSVWLRPDVELWVDADEFERTIKDAWRSTDPLALLEQASALYAGHYLPDDLYEDWATERREALKQDWAELQIRLSRELERRGDADAGTHHLQRVLHLEPCDERAAQEAMQLLARHGRRAEALRVYQRLVQALSDELGVEPADETRAIQRQIAAGETSELSLAETFRCGYPFPAPRELIGREAEVAHLDRVLSSGRTAGRAALVGGPAGAGKSALIGQLVKHAQSKGVLCLAGGCYTERGALPLGPFHDALVDYWLAQPAERIRAGMGSGLEDLGQVIPELRHYLKVSDSVPVPPAFDRMRAFGAVHACLRSLAERGPVLVCLEDLHAADEATVELFHYLARQTRRLPLVLVATFRSDEVPADQPWAQAMAALRRERLADHLLLDSLGRADTDRLVTSLLDGPASQALGEWLFATTDGNPLLVEQVVLALSETGQLQRQNDFWESTTDLVVAPRIVREVIARRLDGLSPSCRQTLAMASVLGQSIERTALVAALAPADEPAIQRDLDESIRADVLRKSLDGYVFRHLLLREAVYWDLSAPRRMLLHARAGQVLEQLRGPTADAYADELAHHFALAGQSTFIRAKALHYQTLASPEVAELMRTS